MAIKQTERGDRNVAAVVYMIISTIGYSLVPLVIALGGGTESPFLLNAGLTLGLVLGYLPFLLFAYGGLLRQPAVLTAIRERVLTWSILFMIINNFEFAFFAWSTKYVDISITAILFETWPILLIMLTAWLYRGISRYRASTATLWLLLALGFLGFAFVVFSQSGSVERLGNLDISALVLGILLAVIASGVTSLSAFGFKWATDLSGHLNREHPYITSKYSLDLFGAIIASLIANAVVIPANLVSGFVIGETLTLKTFAIATGGGVVCHAVATLFWRNANLITNNLGVNAIGYATPIISLFWLFIFSQADVVRTDFLIIGAAAIISANLLINFEAEIRYGFKALILALWGCGAFVYLRDEFLHLLPFDGWLWPRETYLGALGLSATVFILLLTFRVARLGPRTQSEDNRIFALHRNLEMLSRRNLIDGSVHEHIRGIDSAHNPEELRVAYTRARICFAQAAAVEHPPADRKLLADAEAQLNMVAHSRQQGVDFGELFSLLIFGGSTIALAMLSRPAVEGWAGFLYEVFSMLFSAVIVFLIINVWDLHRERADLVLATGEESREYGVIFRDPKNRRFEQGVSVVIGLLIILAYGGLLWNKWVG